jgi:putative colanic acid biosynthesis acetyltransferase WcaF
MNYIPTQTSPFGFGYKLKSRLWNFVNATLFRWSFFFMRRYRVAWLKLFGANVDWTSSIDRTATIVDPWNLTIGKSSSIGEYACIRCRGQVTIGEQCCIGRGVFLLSASHNIESPKFEMITAPISINNNVWIATNAIIGKGITVGEGTVVAAGAVVVKDVEPWIVVGGNPAKPIKKRIIQDKK